MSAYNTLIHSMKCPVTSQDVSLRTQFKFGNTWQFDYKLNEVLKWGGNDVGQAGLKRVIVDGVSEECASCHSQHDIDILIENDKVISATTHREKNNYLSSGKSYIVLEE